MPHQDTKGTTSGREARETHGGRTIPITRQPPGTAPTSTRTAVLSTASQPAARPRQTSPHQPQRSDSNKAPTPGWGRPPARASASTETAAASTAKQPTVQSQQEGGRPGQPPAPAPAPASESGSGSGSGSMTKAKTPICKQPTRQWRQECRMVMTAFPW